MNETLDKIKLRLSFNFAVSLVIALNGPFNYGAESPAPNVLMIAVDDLCDNLSRKMKS